MSANSQVARNQSRQTFGSVYESANPLTTVAGQHMVEWFTGNSLNTDRWGYGGSSGGTANSVAMSDSVDGGLELKAGSSGYNYVNLRCGLTGADDNDGAPHPALAYKRFDPDGCSIICVYKLGTAKATFDESGFGFGTEGMNYVNRDNIAAEHFAGNTSYWALRTKISGTSTKVDSDVVPDTSFHTHRIDLTATYCNLSIDGIQKVTNTTGLVTVAVDPTVACSTWNNATCSMNLTYMEAWNH